MPRHQVVFHAEHVFDADVITRHIGGHEIAFASASNRDPIHDVIATQILLTIDGTEMLRKTLRVEGRSCDAVIDFGPGLGEGRLTLHWALMPQAGGYLAHGYGDWNGADLEEFAVNLATGKDGRMVPHGNSPMAALRLDTGGFAEPGSIEAALVETLAGFREAFEAMLPRGTGCVNDCVEASTLCILNCTAGALDEEAPTPPACALLCAIVESTRLTACARAAGH